MTGLLSNASRIKRFGLVAGLLGVLLVLNLGPDAGAAAQCTHNQGGDSACMTKVMTTFRLSASPRQQRIRAGATARYTIRITRRQFGAAISFRLTQRVPRGLTIRFSRRSTRGSRIRLVIRTSSHLAPRRYRLKVRARSRRVSRTLTVILTILRSGGGAAAVGASGSATTGQPAPYSIAGNAAGPLEPGLSQPLDLQITNPNSTPLMVTSLSVAIQAIQAPRATASLPCLAGDFAVQQYSGPLPLVVQASSTVSLAGLGAAPAAQPQISLLDLPSNQDGCQGASVALSYTASATTG